MYILQLEFKNTIENQEFHFLTKMADFIFKSTENLKFFFYFFFSNG